jgi:acyl-CoA synthetase (AMP-forming)/AMP-acid ligase II
MRLADKPSAGHWHTSDDLEAFATARLAGFKRPRRWRFVSELPRNGLGKLQRLRLGEGWR